MRILVDADACPTPAKEILYRVSERLKIALVMVANSPLRLPGSPLISMEVVPQGADEADDHIVEIAVPDDLVITADIPLAARVIRKSLSAAVLDPRGTFLTEANIAPRLALRDLMDNLRTEGLSTGGPGAYSPKNKQAFANQLDKWLQSRPKNLFNRCS
jgi:uncharacterized protein YaiI (UPF0178 family)